MASINCMGVPVGPEVLACVSASTEYVIGWYLIVTIMTILFFRLNRETMSDRLTATLFVGVIITMLGTIRGMLFPTSYFPYLLVAFVIVVVASIVSRGRNP